MVAQIKIGTRMYSFHFLEAERKIEFDIGCSIGIVRKLFMVVETVVVVAETEGTVPLHPHFLPIGKPFHLVSRTDEKLHFHLLELPHAEDELPCNYLIAKSLAYLCDTERELHAARLVNIQEIDENTLCGFGTEVYRARPLGHRAYLSGEHKVELPHLGPVLGTGNRACYVAVENQLPQAFEVVRIQSGSETVAYGIDFRLIAQDIRISSTELFLVEGITEFFTPFFDILRDFFLQFSNIILHKDIGTVPFL